MLRTIYLYDELAEFCGRDIIKLDVSTPGEVVSAINANFNGFTSLIRQDGYYAIVLGKDIDEGIELGKKQLYAILPDHYRDIHFFPVIDGYGGGRSKGIITAILGVALVAVAIWNPPVAGVAGGKLLATSAGAGALWGLSAVTVGLMGASLVLSGVSSLISSSVGVDDYDKLEDSSSQSYMFGDVVNRAAQGGAIPLIYGGPLFVGSTVVSAGVYITDTSTGGYKGEKCKFVVYCPSHVNATVSDGGDRSVVVGGGKTESIEFVKGVSITMTVWASISNWAITGYYENEVWTDVTDTDRLTLTKTLSATYYKYAFAERALQTDPDDPTPGYSLRITMNGNIQYLYIIPTYYNAEFGEWTYKTWPHRMGYANGGYFDTDATLTGLSYNDKVYLIGTVASGGSVDIYLDGSKTDTWTDADASTDRYFTITGHNVVNLVITTP